MRSIAPISTLFGCFYPLVRILLKATDLGLCQLIGLGLTRFDSNSLFEIPNEGRRRERSIA